MLVGRCVMRTAESVLLMCWPSRTRCPERIDAQVRRVDLHFDRVVDLGIHEYAGERRVAARIGVEGTLAHEAMDAGFGAQVAVRVVAVHLDRCALDAGDFAFRLFQDLGLVTTALAIAQIHALEHRCPILRLRAAAAGLDVDEARVGIHRIVEHPAEFHVIDDAFELGNVALQRDQRRIVALRPRHFEQFRAVRQTRAKTGERVDYAFELFLLAAQLLRPLLVIPDLGVLQHDGNRLQPLRFGIEVKDTSAGRQRAAAARRGDWREG